MTLQKDRVYILAGATGSEILRRGFPTKLPLWSAQVLFEKPELVRQIYVDYIRAGADIIVTNTFRTQRRTLAKAGRADATGRINRLAVDLALQARGEAAGGQPVLIGASMTTLEDCYRPDLLPTAQEMEAEHREQAQLLASAPIDFFLLETFNSIQEAVIAARAAAATGKPLMVSFTANTRGDILNGDQWSEAIRQVEEFSPLAIMVNCVPPAVATAALEKIKRSTALPFGAYANGAGEADTTDGWKFSSGDRIGQYLDHCRDWADMGATIIGGCCGTNHEYTRAYRQFRRPQ
ncbi:MAG: Homocysteine S-methyltransferase [Parcubacteria group bacterium Gr01-1014_31]|nr:MAG: Homocysteine S-methyltransferase [Parcubacteria group bacterium Gr01-1014_31]